MEAKRRLVFLDLFRGTAILLMVFANSLEHYQQVPACLKHAPSSGFNLPDIVAPMFLFAIGYGGELSFQSRCRRNGRLKTVGHLIVRYLLLFTFGFIGTLFVRGLSWDILQTIGTVGILAIPFFFLPPAVRVAVALLSAIGYQLIVSGLWAKTIAEFVAQHGLGAPFAAFSLVFILISGSSLSAWLKEEPLASRIVRLLAFGASLLVAESIFGLWIPYQKSGLHFALVTTGICAGGLSVFMAISEQFQISFQPLEAMGKNALVLYMLSSVLIIFEGMALPYNVSFPAALAGFLTVLLAVYLVGTVLAWKQIYIKL